MKINDLHQQAAVTVAAAIMSSAACSAFAGGLPNPANNKPLHTSALIEYEAQETSRPGLARLIEAARGASNELVESVSSGAPGNPDNVKRVERILQNGALFESLFPSRKTDVYTYDNLLKAVAKYPGFCTSYADARHERSDTICRRLLAASFAHIKLESAGLTAMHEMTFSATSRNGPYSSDCAHKYWVTQAWPCGKWPDGSWQSYHGRGAKQLTYVYNYAQFSKSIFGDARVLVDRPNMVSDSWLNIASALWFFVTPQSPKPSMLSVMDETWKPNASDLGGGRTAGFGVTTMIINGAVECKSSATEDARSAKRIKYFTHYSKELGAMLLPDEILGCKGMKPFDERSSSAQPAYWASTHRCNLRSEQTPFSALIPGDFYRCVTSHRPVGMGQVPVD